MLRLRAAETTLAVNDITLDVEEGEIFGLVGPNGAGKTTLIKMLSTLLVPTSGTAQIAGHDIERDATAVRKLVGLVASNERSFYWPLTGRQNMAFFADLYRVPRQTKFKWIDELLELVGLKDAADERFDGYSTGMKQRLALARGLISKPRILFMDEPTKGVDPLGSFQIIELIRQQIVGLWKSTLLITTHNLREIERLCDRVAIMKQGQLLVVGTLDELRARACAVETFELVVRGIDEQSLHAGLRRVGLPVPHALAAGEGGHNVRMSIRPDSDELARAITNIVTAGGQVMRCEASGGSFDDVFQALVTDSAQESVEPPTDQSPDGGQSAAATRVSPARKVAMAEKGLVHS